MVYRSDSVSMASSQEGAAASLDEGRYRLVPGTALPRESVYRCVM